MRVSKGRGRENKRLGRREGKLKREKERRETKPRGRERNWKEKNE